MGWKLGDDEAMRERIRAEYQIIHRHLGDEAPDPSGTISPQVNKDGMIQFITDTEVYALADDVAVRWRPSPDGNEDVTYWRDGSKVRHIVNPPPPVSN
jgi:hypothetical protein